MKIIAIVRATLAASVAFVLPVTIRIVIPYASGGSQMPLWAGLMIVLPLVLLVGSGAIVCAAALAWRWPCPLSRSVRTARLTGLLLGAIWVWGAHWAKLDGDITEHFLAQFVVTTLIGACLCGGLHWWRLDAERSQQSPAGDSLKAAPEE